VILLLNGRGYLKLFPLVYGWSNLYSQPESPQTSPNKKSKKGKVSGMFSNLLWAIHLIVAPFFQGSPVARVKADPDSSGLPGNVSISPFFKPNHQTFQTSLMALLLPHRTRKFLQNFEPHPLPPFSNDRRVPHEGLLQEASLRLLHPLLSRRKVLFGH
jgi:hypothetical protein